MKITTQVDAQTNEKQVALRTDPPLNEEIFKAAMEQIDNQDRKNFSTKDGLLIVHTSSAIPPSIISTYNDILSAAQHACEQRQKNQALRRETLLQDHAAASGLPRE